MSLRGADEYPIAYSVAHRSWNRHSAVRPADQFSYFNLAKQTTTGVLGDYETHDILVVNEPGLVVSAFFFDPCGMDLVF